MSVDVCSKKARKTIVGHLVLLQIKASAAMLNTPDLTQSHVCSSKKARDVDLMEEESRSSGSSVLLDLFAIRVT